MKGVEVGSDRIVTDQRKEDTRENEKIRPDTD